MRTVTAAFFALALGVATGCQRTDRSQTQPSEDTVKPAPTAYGGGPKSDSNDQSGGTDRANPGSVDDVTGPQATKDGGMSSSPIVPDIGRGLTGPGTDINSPSSGSSDTAGGSTP